MTALFEHNRTEWSLDLSEEEIARVGRVVLSVSRRSTDASVVWLVKVSPTRRLWIVREGGTLVWIAADASASDPDFALPLPEHFIEEMVSLVGTEEVVTLFCDERQDAIICRAGERYLAVDHPREVEFGSLDLPYIGQPGRGGTHALAVLQEDDMETFARTCTNVPSRIDIDLYPFVQVRVGGGEVCWTMDWRRFGLWRLTKSVPARTEGEATVSFYPWLVCRALLLVGIHGDARMFVAGPDADFVYIVGDDWGARVANYPEQMGRWYHPLRRVLASTGCELLPHRGDHLPRSVRFTTPGGHGCAASVLRLEDGTAETILLSHVLATGVHDTEAVLHRLSLINSDIVGARVVLREGELRVVIEFPAEDLEVIEAHLERFTAAIEACGTGVSFLPLFSG